VTFTP